MEKAKKKQKQYRKFSKSFAEFLNLHKSNPSKKELEDFIKLNPESAVYVSHEKFKKAQSALEKRLKKDLELANFINEKINFVEAERKKGGSK